LFLETGDISALAYHNFTVVNHELQVHGEDPSSAGVARQVNQIQTETKRIISNSDCRRNNNKCKHDMLESDQQPKKMMALTMTYSLAADQLRRQKRQML
jgi:hypothetical protein